MAISTVLHLVAIGALIYLTPLKDMLTEPVAEKKREEPTMSSDKLEELSKSVKELTEERIRDNARQLQIMVASIHRMETDMREEFSKFEERQHETAAEDAAEDAKTALENMKRAREAMEQDASDEEVDKYQTLAQQAQQRATEKLKMVPQTEPLEKQLDANEAQLEAEQAHTEDFRKAANQAGRAAQQVEQQEQNVEKADQGVQNRTERVNQASTAVQEATRKKEDLEKQEGTRNQELRKAEKDMQNAQNRLKREKDQLENVKKDLQQQQQELAQRKDRLEKTEQELEQADKQRVEKQQEAIKKQQKALDEITKVVQQQQQIMVTNTAEREQDAELTEMLTAEMEVIELYEMSREAENEIADTAKEIRAMDLAQVRDIGLEQARDDLQWQRPERGQLARELIEDPARTGEKFEAKKQELKKALEQTTSMVHASQRMIEIAQQSVENQKFGADVNVAMAAQEEEEELALLVEELATEDISGAFADMTQVMQQTGETAPPPPPAIDYEDLTSEEEDQGEMQELNLMEQGEGADFLPALTRDVPAWPSRKMVSEGGVPMRWMFIDTWYTIGPWPNPGRANIDRQYPPDTLIDLDATYVGKDGRSIKWQFMQGDDLRLRPPNPEQYGIWYAYTELMLDAPLDVLIACGTDDRGILKINGVPVWISSKRLKGWDVDEVWRKVHLKKGRNRILYRVENGWIDIGFSLVIRVPDE